ncbi:MAG: hypothetical protein Q8O14_01480 [bacterium]|jgi:ABC-2 type transport system permease protein|nr:hypothetical protein [bacterium]
MDATHLPGESRPITRAARLGMLIRRESWEHRVLWLMPLILVGLVLVGSLLALVAPGRINANLQSHHEEPIIINGEDADLQHLFPGLQGTGIQVELGEVTVGNLLHFFDRLPERVRGQVLFLGLTGATRSLLLPLGLLAAVLALGVLRRESRDRSIYFFKSMPVTELEMIAAKALVLVPGLLLLMAATVVASHLVMLGVASLAALFAGLNPIALLWAPAPLGQVWGHLLLGLAVDFLLFLPVVGLLFALNAWHPARRPAAGLAVLALVVLDKIYLTGGGLLQWLGRHLPPPGWVLRGPRGDVFTEMAKWDQPRPAVGNLDLWSGVLLGLLLLGLAAWLLRWREER